jgi:hypothetical protein
MISTKKIVAAVVEGRYAAQAALAELAGLTCTYQRIAFLADAIGEQIDASLGMNNMAPTECRLHGFAEVLMQHLNLNGKLSPSQTAEVPHKGVNVPTSGVPT